MAVRDLVKIARAKVLLAILCRGCRMINVSIKDIPKKWERFMDTEDSWVSVEFPESEDIASCIYKAKKGSIFKPHKHNDSVEHLVVLKGRIRSVTDTDVRIVSFPNAVYFPKKKPHAIEFLEDTEILVMWHPKKSGWDAEFLKDQSE